MPFLNWLLAAATAAAIDSSSLTREQVRFDPRETIVEADAPPRYIWFIERGFVSVMSPKQDGSSTEVAYVGNRGVFPVQALITEEAIGLAFVARRPTIAYRAEVKAVRSRIDRHPGLKDLFDEAIFAGMTMLALTAACNQLCSASERVVRRILAMTHDSTLLDMTTDEIGEMLGFSRATVSTTYAPLKAKGLIRVGRRGVEVLDPGGLAHHACEHYDAIEDIRRRLRMDRNDIVRMPPNRFY